MGLIELVRFLIYFWLAKLGLLILLALNQEHKFLNKRNLQISQAQPDPLTSSLPVFISDAS